MSDSSSEFDKGLQSEEQTNPRSELARDLDSISSKIGDYFYSSDAVQKTKEGLPITGKDEVWERFKLDAMLSGISSRINGHQGHPSRIEHGINMGRFTTKELPTNIKELLGKVDKETREMSFVVDRHSNELSSEATVIELNDKQKNKSRYLFVRSGMVPSMNSLDIMDVVQSDADSGDESSNDDVAVSFQGINHNLTLDDIARKIIQFVGSRKY